MRLIVASALRFRFLVIGLAAALVYFGTQPLQAMIRRAPVRGGPSVRPR